MTTYSMTPISNGTKIRDQPNTAGKELTRVNAGVMVTGGELFTASRQLQDVFGVVYQYLNDKWLKVTYNGVTGWMAYIHKSEPICNNFKVVETTPPPAPMFPESFVLTDPSGAKAEYIFVRVIE